MLWQQQVAKRQNIFAKAAGQKLQEMHAFALNAEDFSLLCGVQTAGTPALLQRSKMGVPAATMCLQSQMRLLKKRKKRNCHVNPKRA